MNLQWRPDLRIVFILLLAGSCNNAPDRAQAPSADPSAKPAAETVQPEKAFPDSGYVAFRADPATQDIRLYWKDEAGQRFGSLGNLNAWADRQGKQLLFAANGGMFNTGYGPQGLYIEQGKMLAPLDRSKGGGGNFYLRPNGVFYLTRTGRAAVTTSEGFRNSKEVEFATQSGPMLLIDGAMHPAFTKGSANLNIRNGVGILPDGRALFIMSTKPVNFYDFAGLFQKEGCKNALYLDGFVSRTYAPGLGWKQTGGDFGVIIGITAKQP